MPFMWDQFGIRVCIIYAACYMFLTFGLFNMILATIVESTMQAGKLDDAKRARQRQREHLAMAHTVRELVVTLCDDQRFAAKPWWKKTWTTNADWNLYSTLSARITAKQFINAFENPKVPKLLDKLG